MNRYSPITRRTAIKDMGKAGLAVMVFGAAACSSDESGSTTAAAGQTTVPDAGDTSTPVATTVPGVGDTSAPVATAPVATTAWERVVLGNVSAYILYRNGEAALVDTGNPGSEGAIESSLADIGLGWDSVGHVILTHEHNDHVGSLPAVVAAAPEASYYGGVQDTPAMSEFVNPSPIGDGDTVFDLDIIETPGHTAGHICALDPVAGVMVAGDAMFNIGGVLSGSLPQYTADMAMAISSVKKLAEFDYEVALFGHGEPILTAASAGVAEMAAGL